LPIIRIEECQSRSPAEKQTLLNAVIDAVRSVLGADNSELQGRYQAFDADSFIAPEVAARDYIFVEICLFTGRKDETKARLYRQIVDNLRGTDLITGRIDISLDERPRDAWAIRDGTMASRMQFPYPIEV
jgi:phenylpyruvate tautomerase PptA (4-oxalocrotonate tautomerase family)